MGDLPGFLALVGGLAAVLGAVAWLGSRIRRRGIGGGLMGPMDEIYHPGAHQSRLVVQVQERRLAPMPSPDDRPNPPNAAAAGLRPPDGNRPGTPRSFGP